MPRPTRSRSRSRLCWRGRSLRCGLGRIGHGCRTKDVERGLGRSPRVEGRSRAASGLPALSPALVPVGIRALHIEGRHPTCLQVRALQPWHSNLAVPSRTLLNTLVTVRTEIRRGCQFARKGAFVPAVRAPRSPMALVRPPTDVRHPALTLASPPCVGPTRSSASAADRIVIRSDANFQIVMARIV